MKSRWDLERFVDAQADSYERAVGEIKLGEKRSHWMWYIFPQIAGLGVSPSAQFYAIRSLDEARAYLEHPTLGSHLRECVEALQGLGPTTAEAVFGSIDAMKLRSSLTLFHEAKGDPLFRAGLDRWFGGQPDMNTLRLLAKMYDGI